MLITTTRWGAPSTELVKSAIEEQLKEMGYRVYRNPYYFIIMNQAPEKSESWKTGLIWKKTWHSTEWKIISRMRVEMIEPGDFDLRIDLIHHDDTFKDVPSFVEGLHKRLNDLQKEMKVSVMYFPTLGVHIENNLPK